MDQADFNVATEGGTRGRVEENGGNRRSRRLPCRMLMECRGVEWFIYNRSAAYDAVVQSMKSQEESDYASHGHSTQLNAETSKPALKPQYRGNADSSHLESVSSTSTQEKEEKNQNDNNSTGSDASSPSTDSSTRYSASLSGDLPVFLNALPFRIECNKGAVVMGNRNTQSILTAKFDSATGLIDARAPGAVDQYKQTFEFAFSHTVIEFKHNKNHTNSHLSEGAVKLSGSSRVLKEGTRWSEHVDHERSLRNVWNSICGYVLYLTGFAGSDTHARLKSDVASTSRDENSGVYGQNRWLGLTRYLDDDDGLIEQERWKAIEYGAFPTIVDSPEICMCIRWDVPGPVPPLESIRNPLPASETDINGDAPPEWAVELKIRGGTINYGPWADRQRANLQAVFFPALYKDAVPAAKLRPGQSRISTVLKVVLDIEEQTTLRVPTREDSKDWKWKGQAVTPNAANTKGKKIKDRAKINKGNKVGQPPGVRPFGWLDIKVSPNSTVNVTMDLLARSIGYKNCVDLDLKGVEVSSSVNHALFWRSHSQVISCNLSNPLDWGSLRHWHIDIKDDGLELFMLRDHMFLLTDLVNDWTSGPLGDFHTFIPFEYSIDLCFVDLKLFFNANDSNIINNPSDPEDNNFVILWGQRLQAGLGIPVKNFRPVRNEVKFDFEVVGGGVDLRTSPRNTQHTFLTGSNVATLTSLKVDGSYRYFTTTSPNLTDTLLMSVLAKASQITLYGFLVRYLMKIKDNYFGEDIHFRTLEEYQSHINMVEGQNPEILAPGLHSRISNDLDVILDFSTEDLCALLPARLYSPEINVRLEIPSIALDLRITNYYMDLAICFSPIAISHTSLIEPRWSDTDSYSSTQVFIDGLEIFGHRLFGLPPTEPTYVCNWDFDIRYIRGECSVDFCLCLSTAFRCFTLSFVDAENALPPLIPLSIHDVTFLRARVRSVLVALRIDQTAFLLGVQEAKIEYNDWAGPHFSDRLYVLVPDLTLSIVDAHGASMEQSLLKSAVKTHAYMKVTLESSRVKRKQDSRQTYHVQQDYIKLHDSRTGRVPWLVLKQEQPVVSGIRSRTEKLRTPAMTFPLMPEPLSPQTDIEASAMPAIRPSTAVSSGSSSFLSRSFSKYDKANTDDDSNQTSRCQQRHANDPYDHFQSIGYQSSIESRVNKEDYLLPGQRDPRKQSSVEQNHLAGLAVAFTSPYKQPYFPLLDVQPDIGDVPVPPKRLLPDASATESKSSNIPRLRSPDQGPEQYYFMANMSQGVQFMFTPEAILTVTQLLARFQTTDTVALLDTLQLDAMTDVLSAEAKRTEGGRIFDVRVFIPWVGARFVSMGDSSLNNRRRHERYEMVLENLALTVRSSQDVSKIMPSSPGSHSSFHLALDRMICSAKESKTIDGEDEAAIRLTVRDPVAWIWYGRTTAAEMQFHTLEIESLGRRVDHVSSLVQQTLVMSEDFTQRFRKIQKQRESRLRLLVLLLTVAGKDVPDPPFLTRLSYVLRSASHHLRTSDSWKIMSRLRYIYHCLPAQTRDKIHAQCVSKLASCPEDAESRVIASFEHWSRWDLAHARSSLLLQRVFGQSLNSIAQDLQKPVSTRATLRAGNIQILVEPGPSQNKVAIEDLIVSLALHRPDGALSLPSTVQSSVAKTSTVQVHFAKVAIRLHWDLLELIEDLVGTIQRTQFPRWKRTKSVEAASQPLSQASCLHFALSVGQSTLILDTKNLKIILLCQGLRVSSVSLQTSSGTQTSLSSVLVDADVATSEVQRYSTDLILFKLRRPKILGSKNSTAGRNAGNSWKLINTSEEMSFLVLANPLETIEVADSVLKEEIAHLSQWMKSVRLFEPSARLPTATTRLVSLLEVHIALSLDFYVIGLTLLPSLVYQIRGERARTWLKSVTRGRNNVVVDVDIKEHFHTLQSSLNDDSHDLSRLHIPFISIRLSIDLSSKQKSVVFKTLVGSIIFDASAAHVVLTIINRPEMGSLLENFKEAASSLQDRYKQIFGTTESRDATLSAEPLLYNAYVTLLRLAVQANTSDSSSLAPGAYLQMRMDRIRLRTTNTELGYGAAMKFPEAEVNFKTIHLELLRYESNDLQTCGNIALEAVLKSMSGLNDQAELVRTYQIQSSSLQVNLYPDTALIVVSVLTNLQDTLKTIDLSHEVQTLKKLGHARLRDGASPEPTWNNKERGDVESAALFSSMCSLEMTNICIAWKIGDSVHIPSGREPEDLVLSFAKIDLSTKKANAARLLIQDFQLQMVPHSKSQSVRSQNSALLPEVIFNVAYVSMGPDRRLAFQAAGKSMEVQLTSHFILPASDLRLSIAQSIQQVRTATSDWKSSPVTGGGQRKPLFSDKKLASLLVDADFAGAVVSIGGGSPPEAHSLALDVPQGVRLPWQGRYNLFTPDNANNSTTSLRSPGIAFKIEYRNGGPNDQSLNAEVKIDASSNVLYPTVVPLIMEISSSIRDVVGDSGKQTQATKPSFTQPKFLDDERLRGADPVAILGDCKLNLGLRICMQEFSLSCQPIARVAATARFEDIYMTLNTVQSNQHGRFYTMSVAFTKLHASVQHVYSRESTGSFEVDSVVVSLMNSKHIRTASGISAIINISPMKAQMNAKQSQDFFLFREIWLPPEIKRSSTDVPPVPAPESQAFVVQRYQHIAAAGAFPWDATVSIAELNVQLDLGQSLGRSALTITDFWISSKKTSDWEQNLCVWFSKMAVDSTGRMSGLVEMEKFKVRTSIQWPIVIGAQNQTPWVQASLAFDSLRVKASFDFQAFFIANITFFEFLMYNVRDLGESGRDRLVGVLNGDKVQVCCTTSSASQAIALYQAFQRLYQEKSIAYETSLRDIEKFLRRKASTNTQITQSAVKVQDGINAETKISPLRLQTNVVVTLKSVNIGAFPSTFADGQILKLEAFDASARFAVVLEHEKVHTNLGMTLGQLRVGLASVTRTQGSKTLGEISVSDIVASVTSSRGGTILKVPKLVAIMETWQKFESTDIEYTFKSSFQGKVDVGWNYSRVSYIRGMWNSHARALAQRLGKPIPQSAVQITGGPRLEGGDESSRPGEGDQEKITAVVNVPQSKYRYTALQPPIVETPQLRDMGEATPPLEWIGLHREKLPNLTHQIIIVTLLEVAKEVDDAYSKILGSS